MIKLGKLTDYAVVIMGQMWKDGVETAHSAHYLSGRTGVPEPTVAKVLKTLAREGLVTSTRGATGGYRLARAPEQISIADIVTAMDGPIALTACVTGADETCRAAAMCHMKGCWTRVNSAIKSALDSVKLSELAGDSAGCGQHYDFTGEAKAN